MIRGALHLFWLRHGGSAHQGDWAGFIPNLSVLVAVVARRGILEHFYKLCYFYQLEGVINIPGFHVIPAVFYTEPDKRHVPSCRRETLKVKNRKIRHQIYTVWVTLADLTQGPTLDQPQCHVCTHVWSSWGFGH